VVGADAVRDHEQVFQLFQQFTNLRCPFDQIHRRSAFAVFCTKDIWICWLNCGRRDQFFLDSHPFAII